MAHLRACGMFLAARRLRAGPRIGICACSVASAMNSKLSCRAASTLSASLREGGLHVHGWHVRTVHSHSRLLTAPSAPSCADPWIRARSDDVLHAAAVRARASQPTAPKGTMSALKRAAMRTNSSRAGHLSW